MIRMTVVAETELGSLLDHRTFWINCLRGFESLNVDKATAVKTERSSDRVTLSSEDVRSNRLNSQQISCHKSGLVDSEDCRPIRYVPKKELFSIYNPYQMDTQFEKYSALQTSTLLENSPSGKTLSAQCDEGTQERKVEKKRKRKPKKTKEISGNEESIKQFTDHLSQALASLVHLGLLGGFFSEWSTLPYNNNREARHLALQDVTDMATSVEPLQQNDCSRLATGEIQVGRCYRFTELCHTLYTHGGCSPTVMNCEGDQFLIPPHTAFYLSQMEDISSFLTCLGGKKFDFIVIDPPWENKSVKRKKQYYTLANWHLSEVPVSEMANDECLVVVWVTNKQKHQDYVREVLFPKWSVKYLSHWHWLKVTLGAEPITDIWSHGKKPYESLMIGRMRIDKEMMSEATALDPPLDRVIISVPCVLHSKKPPLEAIMKKYCVPNAQCLELFARNLTSGWTSWGNEVLRHQHMKFYTTETN